MGQAEALGFESIWMGEHPIIPVNIGTPYPFRDDGQIPDFYSQIADPFIGVTRETQCGDMLKRYEDAGAQRAILFLGHTEGLLAFSSVHFFRPAETDGILEGLAENSITQL